MSVSGRAAMPFSTSIKPEPHSTTGFPILLHTSPTRMIMAAWRVSHAATLGDSNETQFQTLKCFHFQWKAAQKYAEGVRSQTELMYALEKRNCSFRPTNHFQSWRSAKSAEPRYRFLSLKFSSPTPQCVRCTTWSRSLAELQCPMSVSGRAAMPFSTSIKPEPHSITGFPILLYTFPTGVIMRCVTLFARNDAGKRTQRL